MSATPIFVCKRHEFRGEDARFVVTVGGRSIAIIAYRGIFYAIDNFCYHHGGPLLMGDIEDVGGHTCIICPWHHYPISLESGEGFYKALDFSSPRSGHHLDFFSTPLRTSVGVIKSKGCRQRIHVVEVLGDDVFLILNTDPTPLDSDTYSNSALSYSKNTLPMTTPVEKQ